MIYETKTVDMAQIDSSDLTFCLGWRKGTERLERSIEDHGLLNPPVLRQKSDGTFSIVCGFRRVQAVEKLGWSRITAQVAGNAVGEAKLIELVVSDNRSHRNLNVIEQAQGIRKLTALDPDLDPDSLASLLGFSANRKVFEKIRSLAALPEKVQAGLLEDAISFEAAVDLTTFSSAEAVAFFDLLSPLKLSQNKEKEIINLVYEIAQREGLSISEVLGGHDVKSVVNENDLNRGEKGNKLRQYVKKRRFPHLVKTEQKFDQAIRELKLPASFRLLPPANFEGENYSVCLSFKDVQGLKQGCKELKRLSDHPVMRKLFELQGRK